MADYTYVTSTGVVVPDTSTTLQDVINEYQGIFGDDLVTDPSTPEGMLIAAETTSRQSVARNNATLANQLNPNLAGGQFLDAIWALTGGQRVQATRSTVSCTLAGIANTTIPAGSQARTTAGALFEAVNTVIIPASGTLTGVAFQSVETGAIAAGAGTLTQIVDAILGWDTITNPAGAVLGLAEESDAVSRARRRQTLGLIGRSVSEAITSAINDIDGVNSLAYRENTSSTTMTIDGISLVAHSIWVCVDGGADTAIAQALLTNKTAGAAFNGAQSVSVTDPFSGQSYAVLFDRPTPTAIAIQVTITSGSEAIDPADAIRTAILNYAAGIAAPEPGFVVGADVSPWEIAGAVNVANPTIFVVNVGLSSNVINPVFTSAVISIPLNGIATITAGNITVIVQ